MINQLTIRHELHPGRYCMRFRYADDRTREQHKCNQLATFSFDAPGELALDLCHYHARKGIVDLIDQMHAEALRDYDQQTTRLQLTGKPCKVCGVRREEHPTRLSRVYNEGLSFVVDHNWTDDEATAEAYERDHK